MFNSSLHAVQEVGKLWVIFLYAFFHLFNLILRICLPQDTKQNSGFVKSHFDVDGFLVLDGCDGDF